jgi:hypothetical protein
MPILNENYYDLFYPDITPDDYNFLNKVNESRVLGFNWTQIQKLVNVTKSFLTAWKKRIKYVDPLDDITDAELDDLVNQFILTNRNRGEIMTWGFILSEGYRVSRDRLRQSINRVDPMGRQIRGVMFFIVR